MPTTTPGAASQPARTPGATPPPLGPRQSRRRMRTAPVAPRSAAGPLSPREVKVLRLAAAGAQQAAIAAALTLSLNTVKTHLGRAAAKLGAASRAETLRLAAERGLLPSDPRPPRARAKALTEESGVEEDGSRNVR